MTLLRAVSQCAAVIVPTYQKFAEIGTVFVVSAGKHCSVLCFIYSLQYIKTEQYIACRVTVKKKMLLLIRLGWSHISIHGNCVRPRVLSDDFSGVI